MLSASDLLILSELPGIGEKTLVRLAESIRRRGEGLRHILAASPAALRHTYGLPAIAVARLTEKRELHLTRCAWIGGEIERAGARILTPRNAAYPAGLRAFRRPPPPMLYTLGNPDIAKRRCVSIMSSREITGETLPAIAAVVERARKEGLAVALGGMKSTHRLAAMTARALRAERIVVLDRGLLSAFAGDFTSDPFGTGERKALLDRRRTLALSVFRAEDHAAPNSGRRRDEIIASLGDLIFVGSARRGGETERIAQAAMAQGKPVLVWRDGGPSLLAAGALRLEPRHLALGLRRFLDERAAEPPSRRPARGRRAVADRRRRSPAE